MRAVKRFKNSPPPLNTPSTVIAREVMRKIVKDSEDREPIRLQVSVCKIDSERQILTGEVYAPWLVDSHGDVMEPEAVEELAHSFMSKSLNNRIDIMHNNQPALAIAIESYIAKDSDEFNEGAWVLSVKLHDSNLWESVKSGTYNGYSLEAMVTKVPAIVEVEIQSSVFGITEKDGGKEHDHLYFIEVDDLGKVIRGHTSVDRGHKHDILAGTATEKTEEHAHRFFLP